MQTCRSPIFCGFSARGRYFVRDTLGRISECTVPTPRCQVVELGSGPSTHFTHSSTFGTHSISRNTRKRARRSGPAAQGVSYDSLVLGRQLAAATQARGSIAAEAAWPAKRSFAGRRSVPCPPSACARLLRRCCCEVTTWEIFWSHGAYAQKRLRAPGTRRMACEVRAPTAWAGAALGSSGGGQHDVTAARCAQSHAALLAQSCR